MRISSEKQGASIANAPTCYRAPEPRNPKSAFLKSEEQSKLISACSKPTTEFAQPCLSRVKGRSSPVRGYKFGCVCSYMASHEDAGVVTGHIGTNTPKFVPPRWGQPHFDQGTTKGNSQRAKSSQHFFTLFGTFPHIFTLFRVFQHFSSRTFS